MSSRPRWVVVNGAGVILIVCDEEVSRYETATLTTIGVPTVLLPPPTIAMDEPLVVGLPDLEPYARLFHRYCAIASPSATQILLLGLLEVPPSWALDALDPLVQLVELLRVVEDYASGMWHRQTSMSFETMDDDQVLLYAVDGGEVQFNGEVTRLKVAMKIVKG
ncbi:unnamed protein product [Lactuca saligna]|uniref:Uncharacterized protein n=1 Tax=Lactuca saligna TaxID=75948 RepID=A0AA35YKC8_LACSI|nr:unnamed protein product [Lactuca saligna]